MNKPDQADMDRPFPGFPVCSRYVAIGPVEEARVRICRILDRGEALGVVMGPPGTGKTLLCQKIASLYRHSHAIVNLGDIRVSSRLGLIQQVLFHLGKPHLGADEGALHLALVQSLTQSIDGPHPLLLIIDEAQMLSADLLDEIRMMTNLVRQGRPMVQMLLVGGPRLDDALADPQLESLTQRISVRCYLHPLTHDEAQQYIRTSMSVMALPIDDQAITSVHHASGGIPRLINQLMDQAIQVARVRQKSRLDDACVQSAWSELQQLPSPVLESELRTQGTAVEFGDLDGETFDFAPQATPGRSSESPHEPLADDGVLAIAATADEALSEATDADELLSTDLPLSPEDLSPYSDIASVLDSTSIDCLSQAAEESSSQHDADAPSSETLASFAEEVTPVELKTSRTTLPMRGSGEPFTPADDELFGVGFDQEMPLDIVSTQGPRRVSDPAHAELALHEEIRRLSSAAQSVLENGCVEQAGAGSLPPQATAKSASELPQAPLSPACDLPEELAEPLLAGSLAVVWSDEEVATLQGDDRDMLVIEEDVTMTIDPPQGSFVASGALRKPTEDIEQNYQQLFSRLRGGQ